MRNLFDQYTQPENRLTHALACTLNADKAILASFLRTIGVTGAPPVERLRVVEQRLPGEEIEEVDLSEAKSQRRGLPDVCIFDEDAESPWALLIESKAQAKANVDQLNRHRATLARRGFANAAILLITIDPPLSAAALPVGALAWEWRDVYAWLRREHPENYWSRTMTEYMEVFETKMAADDYDIRGTITMFDGLRFDADHPYNYPEAKRLIRLLGDELRKRSRLTQVGIDLKGEGRGKITRGRESVWDFLPLEAARGSDAFTAYPHFTFYIERAYAGAQLSVPNGVKNGFLKRLEALGSVGFERVLVEIEKNLRVVLERSSRSRPYVQAIQRHWLSRSSGGIEDAKILFDPRTVVPGGRDRIKYQPEWALGIYNALTEKRSNISLSFGVHLSYDCEIVRSPKVIDLFADTYCALQPALALAAPEALPAIRKTG